MHRPSRLAIVLAAASLLPALAPAQNPIQAAKDAYKRARQQQQQQQQQQSPQQQKAAQPASGSQDASAPWTPPSDDAAATSAAAVHLDPARLPDVVGIRIGMPAAEALAILHKNYPVDMFVRMPANAWPSVEKPDTGYNIHSREPGNFKDFSVSFTAPPGPQQVWRITRMTQRMHINRDTFLAALREKYGRETIAFTPSGQTFRPGDPMGIGSLYWLYDEAGSHQPLPPETVFGNSNAGIRECARNETMGSEPVMPINEDFARRYNEWCSHHFVILSVSLGFTNAGFEIVEYTNTTMEDVPLAIRTAAAANTWLRNLAQQQHQNDVERSKAKKPVL